MWTGWTLSSVQGTTPWSRARGPVTDRLDVLPPPGLMDPNPNSHQLHQEPTRGRLVELELGDKTIEHQLHRVCVWGGGSVRSCSYCSLDDVINRYEIQG